MSTANKAISDLTELTEIIGNDLLVVEHSGEAYKVKAETLLGYLQSNVGGE